VKHTALVGIEPTASQW